MLSLLALGAAPAAAQDDGGDPAPTGGALSAEGYVALSADERAQLSLDGFRRYLDRTRDADPSLYALLDPRLDDLEYREDVADVIFWTGTALGAAAIAAGIPVWTEVDQDAGIAMVAGGAGLFLVGLIVQAILRPGHGDLMAIVDLYDERLGRR